MSTIGSDMAHPSAHQTILLTRADLQSEHQEAASALERLAPALERAGARDLGALVDELQGPVLDAEEGTLSFQALAGTNVDHFRGQTFWEALTSPHTDPGDLQSLAQFGGSLARVESRSLIGGVIQVLALQHLERLNVVALTPPETVAIQAVLAALAMSEDMPDAIRNYAFAMTDSTRLDSQ
jgi:hypothetical protein